MIKISEIKRNIISVIISLSLLFIIIEVRSYMVTKHENNRNIAMNELITVQEKIGLSQLFNVSGYNLTNSGSFVNPFEEKVYGVIYEIRKQRPDNQRYFFCDVNEFTKISDLFERNINGNQTIKEIGFKIIKDNRENCFKNNK